jgi:hypothetical protein
MRQTRTASPLAFSPRCPICVKSKDKRQTMKFVTMIQGAALLGLAVFGAYANAEEARGCDIALSLSCTE